MLSLSTARKYIDPGPPAAGAPPADFVEELGFIDTFLEYLGQCATPLAMFATGMWMHGHNPFKNKIIKSKNEGLIKENGVHD